LLDQLIEHLARNLGHIAGAIDIHGLGIEGEDLVLYRLNVPGDDFRDLRMALDNNVVEG